MNELLLIAQLLVIYTAVVVTYRIFGKTGMFCWTVFATIAANIEVLMQVDAFGMQMTLGNVLFASTFVVTDILSENHGKKDANLAVNVGIFTSAMFIIVSQSWLLFRPNEVDFATPAIHTIFSCTPRVMLSGLIVYAVTQKFDVWLYHRIWRWTTVKQSNSSKMLWLRNNAATLVSQMLNTMLYNFIAFYGVFEMSTLWSIVIASYLIFIVTSIADTPVVYFCRRLRKV